MHNHPLIVANWKMNTTLADAVIMTERIKNGLEKIDDVKAVICPPFPWLVPLAEKIWNHPIRQLSLGAQNVSHFEKGAFTGEVAAFQLKNLAEYCIVGHSERISHLRETLSQINQKIKLLLKNQIIPIVCVGEERKQEGSIQEVKEKAREIFKSLTEEQIQAVVLAYEPVWAISSNLDAEPATGEYASKVTSALAREFPGTKIIYGGSVDSKNIREFMSQKHIGGGLVGSASLSAEEFLEIVRNA
jgi:triosephosphate isomerase